MAYDDHKSSADLQREVEQQRSVLENRIDSIQEKLSPGQLVDEVLNYTKGGGGEFLSGLQRNVTANPLPVALLGVSLAWLIAKPAPAAGTTDRQWDDSINDRRGFDGGSTDESDYPVAVITGSSLKRVSHTSDHSGTHYSEFLDDAGKKYKAASDAAGRRAGHFVDETGKSFRGFSDSAGARVEHFRDEAGNLLDEASGWASHNWRKASDMLHGAKDSMGRNVKSGVDGAAHAGQAFGSQVNHAGQALGSQVNSLNQTLMQQFKDQPLVAGALAFAVGAAFGSALPHTEQEDELMGDAADAAKDELGAQAEHLYEEGRDKAAELYESASETAGELYEKARDGAADAANSARTQNS